jgi:peptidyl-prolyl cis-trans isomerase SurA
MLKPLLAAYLALCCATVFSQTLFTYGGDTVTVPQFLAAYTKNNSTDTGKQALRTYLDLYIASRLKIKEAKARGYDTLPQITADLANLRQQIIPAYLHDEAAVKGLVQEAALRSAKDIHLHTIFIAFTHDGKTDTAAALQRAHGILKKLENGEYFETVARQFSDDPSAKWNGGDAGFITVFTLPYAIENIVYKTPAGSIAPLYRSKSGYHIFKNGGERPALGSIRAAQILIAFPPGADVAAKAHARKLADSLYTTLGKGADFAKLAAQFSNDVVSAQAEGEMPAFGVGAYDATFEKAVFELPKDGAISKPFQTAHGYHIVKRLERIPVSTDTTDGKAMQALREKVENSDRMKATQQALVQRILAEARYQKRAFDETALWAYTDSMLESKPVEVANAISPETELFTLGGKTNTVAGWIMYARNYRYNSDGSGLKEHRQLWDEFVQATAMDYYKDHLEEYNEAFRQQLEEFKDGNLFFEIMQRDVWNKAQEDTAALQIFYKAHAANYRWNKSADAVLFYCNDAATAKKLKTQLQKAPASWKTLVTKLGEKVAADSGRFELSQIPNSANQVLQKGTITQPVINTADNTASFALILKLYNTPSQRSFAEAKGLVVSDYQTELEKKWIAELKKKYPVVINETELENLAPGSSSVELERGEASAQAKSLY